MPYQYNSELPQSIQQALSEKQQDIYREAFNNAWKDYKSSNEGEITHNIEESAHSVAWAAVKDWSEVKEIG